MSRSHMLSPIHTALIPSTSKGYGKVASTVLKIAELEFLETEDLTSHLRYGNQAIEWHQRWS